MVVVIGIVVGLAVGAGVTFLSLYAFTGSRLAAARRTRQLLISEAKRDSDAMRREAQIEAREESVRLRAEIEQEIAERRSEILKIEERVLAKEEEHVRADHNMTMIPMDTIKEMANHIHDGAAPRRRWFGLR